MSYLSFGKTLNLNKATISIWFRIPQASAAAAAQPPPQGSYLNFSPDFEVFDGIIPILVFGKQKPATCTNWYYKHLADQPIYFVYNPGDPTTPIYDMVPIGSHSGWLAPSFIGVNADGYLAVHLQTDDIGIASQISFSTTSYEIHLRPIQGSPAFFWNPIVTYTDTSDQQFTYPDSLGNDGQQSGSVASPRGFRANQNGFKVAFDVWHHLLLSWDIGSTNASHGVYWGSPEGSGTPVDRAPYVDSSSTMYCAIDDINKNGDELPGMRYPNMEPNKTVSYGTYNTAGGSNNTGPPNPPGQIGGATAQPEYMVTFSSGIQVDGVFIPGEPQYNVSYPVLTSDDPSFLPPLTGNEGPPAVNPILKVEMAELQIFTDIMLDTSIEANRRAFIDYKRDAKGAPMPDKNGKLTLVPVDPAKTAKLIGREPDIELHKSGNWIKGNNTGTTGVGADGKPISTGQFTPTGVIKKYKPDPSIVVT